MGTALSPGERELLIDALSDDVAFVWVLIHLGLRTNPPNPAGPPSAAEVDQALEVLDELSRAGLLKVGHMEYIDAGPPGSVAPVRHVEEPIDEVAKRVRAACRGDSDWEWACWVVNTPLGDEVAREALAARGDT